VGKVIGIDLGTTNSAVAVMEGGRVETVSAPLGGGLAFAPDDLAAIFRRLDVVEIRPMHLQPDGGALSGTDFMLVALFRRPA